MFGADYPLLGYERLLGDWKAEGYGEAVLDKVLRRNAEAFLATPREPVAYRRSSGSNEVLHSGTGRVPCPTHVRQVSW
jgi:hypothetical protein